jgi:hypothetical protein
LSPAAISSAAALSGPTPSSARSLGGVAGGEHLQLLGELIDLGVQVLVALGEAAHGHHGGRRWGGQGARGEGGGRAGACQPF